MYLQHVLLLYILAPTAEWRRITDSKSTIASSGGGGGGGGNGGGGGEGHDAC